ncbi:MAG: hypothetical protein AB7O80_15900 [Acetobacteraceae bacterium]
MTHFRTALITMWAILVAYTGVVVAQNGWGLLPVFVGDILRLGWPGQFNLDFLCLLILSGTWVAWRHGFSILGIVLGVLALFGGTVFLFPYLLVVSLVSRGNMRRLLLGTHRAVDPAL